MDSRGSEGAGRRARRPGRSHNAFVLQVCGAALSFILIALLVVHTSQQAFTAQTTNLDNTVTAASLSLTDDDAGQAMFANVGGLVPGQVLDRCITVTYTGTVTPTPVQLYAAAAPTGDLTPYLDLTVDIGTDSSPSFSDCSHFTLTSQLYTGTLSGFASTYSSYDTGLSTWTPASGTDTRAFRFEIFVTDDNAAQGKTSSFGVTWETRSRP